MILNNKKILTAKMGGRESNPFASLLEKEKKHLDIRNTNISTQFSGSSGSNKINFTFTPNLLVTLNLKKKTIKGFNGF